MLASRDELDAGNRSNGLVTPSFSIGVPAFKGAYLRECIDSILLQTVPDFELIVVNDASPDPVRDIVHSYADERIRYYENAENIGAENVVRNWNRCLDYARGRFVKPNLAYDTAIGERGGFDVVVCLEVIEPLP